MADVKEDELNEYREIIVQPRELSCPDGFKLRVVSFAESDAVL